MPTKPKRHSMADALKDRQDVKAFLKAELPSASKKSAEPKKSPERRIAVTVRLPEKIVHALIDLSAERRKKRHKAWSQQEIVTEALTESLSRSDHLKA